MYMYSDVLLVNVVFSSHLLVDNGAVVSSSVLSVASIAHLSALISCFVAMIHIYHHIVLTMVRVFALVSCFIAAFIIISC